MPVQGYASRIVKHHTISTIRQGGGKRWPVIDSRWRRYGFRFTGVTAGRDALARESKPFFERGVSFVEQAPFGSIQTIQEYYPSGRLCGPSGGVG